MSGSFDFFSPRHDLLTSYFDAHCKRRNKDAIETAPTRIHYDRINNLLKFRKDFVAKYSAGQVSGLDLEADEISLFDDAEGFARTLRETALEDLKHFLNGFVADYPAPFDAALKKDLADKASCIYYPDDSIKVNKKLLEALKPEPSNTLKLNNRIASVISGTIAILCFIFLSDDLKNRYDVACKADDSKKLQDAFSNILFCLCVAAISTTVALYNSYKYYQRDTAIDKSPGASNENFLQWLETSSEVITKARPMLKL